MSTDIKAYGDYPFSSDVTYQVSGHSLHQERAGSHFTSKQGLANILAGGTLDANSTPEVREELERRIRVFYFNK